MSEHEHTTGSNQCHLDRRQFIAAAAATAAAGSLGIASPANAAPTATSAAETAVAELYESLSDSQRGKVCLPFQHKLRKKINANWHVTEPEIGSDFYSDSQRELIARAVKSLCSEDGYKLLLQQMEEDSGGIEQYSMAVFGTPESKKCEFELTGRHLTLRADGNSVAGAAFGGPIVYGHAEEDPKKNLFYGQTVQVNKVFKALDAKQSKQALVTQKPPKENAVQLRGANAQFSGLSVGSMSSDQQDLVNESLRVLLDPFRSEDVTEVMSILDTNGGVEKLNMAFYKQGDLQKDKVWDMWRIEGPGFAWHFRGAPHVHAYINIGVKA